MKKFALAFLMMALVQATVLAGGNGPTSTIRIRNSTTGAAAVIVNPPANLNIANPAAFVAAGGRVLSAQETASFKVRQGTNVIAAAFVNTATANPGNVATLNVNVRKNATVNYRVSGGPYPIAPTILPQ